MKQGMEVGEMDMKIETVFKQENIALLFGTEKQRGTFIAEANDAFSALMERKEFGREWAGSFPSGRYVITVYQRHSVYHAGKQVWKNERYRNKVGRDSRHGTPCFVIILDREITYQVPGWGRPLCSHTVRSKVDPLQAEMFSDMETADMAAREFSAQGFMAAVLEWFEDYDMY